MSLRPGSRLGGHGITGPRGEGGMGAVYRATDSKPRREVARRAGMILGNASYTSPSTLAAGPWTGAPSPAGPFSRPACRRPSPASSAAASSATGA